jgi:hypothetical protein
MISPTRISGAVAAAAGTLVLALAGVAGATASPKSKPGDLTFQQTFPLASSVCAKVAAGTENKHLAKFVPQVTADCATLQATFTTNQTAVLAARAAILPTLTADRAAIHSACPNPKEKPERALCVTTRKADRATVKTLGAELRLAYHTYFKSVEAARMAFWAAIKALPGESHIHADKPIPVPPR